MSWPEGWDRGSGGRGPDPDSERTRTDIGRARPELRRSRTDSRDDADATQLISRDFYDQRKSPGPLPPIRRRRGTRPPNWGRRIRLGAALLLVFVLVAAVGGYVYVDNHIQRVDALGDYEGRPDDTPGQDWLIVGSDSRADLSSADRRKLRTGSAVGRRTDTIMLLHTGSNGATLVSLPRDSFVQVPRYTDSQGRIRGGRGNKLNAAYSIGGPELLARTVETATNIRLDHYVEVGLGGFVEIVDSVGGVDLCLKKPIKDRQAGADLKAGCQRLDGPQALSFVRARKFDPRSDLGRVDRQQEFLRALTKRVAAPSVAFNPFTLKPVTDASLAAVSVDNDTGPFDLLRLFLSMRTLSGGDGVTTTVPVGDPDFRAGGGVGSSVRWDEEGSEALFGALREDEKVAKPEK